MLQTSSLLKKSLSIFNVFFVYKGNLLEFYFIVQKNLKFKVMSLFHYVNTLMKIDHLSAIAVEKSL